MKKITTLLFLISSAAFADGSLTPDIRISSELLGYDLQYRVYIPEGADSGDDLSVLFVTDGPEYIRQGRMPRVLDRMIGSGKMEPIVAVFVDARDPDSLRKSRRNSQFLCNKDYLSFYESELIPDIEQNYPVGGSREYRGILGLSYGGTNAACFGLLGYKTFSMIGMHSPANYPVKALLPTYEKMPTLPLRVFLSTGTSYDNTQANRKFRTILKNKGYDLKYIEVREGHNWDNWRPLVDDVLSHFYGTEDQAE